MKPEQVFGVSAGKVWAILNDNKNKPLTSQEIMKLRKLTRDDVMSGLGWLGREGKIEIMEISGKYAYKLI